VESHAQTVGCRYAAFFLLHAVDSAGVPPVRQLQKKYIFIIPDSFPFVKSRKSKKARRFARGFGTKYRLRHPACRTARKAARDPRETA
jgi:hypothetical protein